MSMSTTVRNLLLVFSLLCIIAIIVFSIQLIVINRPEKSDVAAEQSPPVESSPGISTPPVQTSTSTASSPPVETPEQTTSTTPSPSTATPTGTRCEMPLLPTLTIVMYADEEIFDFTVWNLNYVFTYQGAGTASIEILIDYIPEGLEARAQDILSNYTEGAESTIDGDVVIGRAMLSGVTATAMRGDDTYVAWLGYLTESDAMSLELIMQYRNEEQKEAIDALLATLEMIVT